MAARETDLSLSTARVRVPDHIVSRAFPSELVLLNLQTGHYHSLNPTAGRMFRGAPDRAAGRGGGAPVGRAGRDRGPVLRADLVRLTLDLERRGLVEIEYPKGDAAR